MPEERSLEGWDPRVGEEVELEQVVDLAFDYRGDVTVVLTDGRDLTGYVSNRDRDATEPHLTLLDPGGAAHILRYAEIRTIKFTGRDTAAGKSYEAWLRRKADSHST
jgi:hypothetical protein